MSNTCNILFAGFGGQGILFAGKFVAYKGLLENKQVSWLPSYGPEMRGGTANCSVIVSDEPIGSPIVGKPDVLVAMNLPSLDKYEGACTSGAKLIVDSTLIGRKVERDDVEAFYIPATAMAAEIGAPTLANMIMLGKMIKETGIIKLEDVEKGLKKGIPAKKADMLGLNMKAIETGYNF